MRYSSRKVLGCIGAITLGLLSVTVISPARAGLTEDGCTLPEDPEVTMGLPASPNQPIQNRGIYYDNIGLIVHRHSDGTCDGGDTSQREGWYWLGVWLHQHTPGLKPWEPSRRLNFDQVLALLEPNHDGVFYRHPALPPWNNPYDKKYGTSRDQLVPMIAAMGVWGKKAELQRLWDALPQDAQGKHAFNGNWRNALGQNGWNCTELKSRSCGGTMDCSLMQDTRDCTPQADTRSCPANEDHRECSQPHDERGCHHWYGNNPWCEAAKVAQNAIYAANKANCEIAKARQNATYALAKGTCEANKVAQNTIYKAQQAPCESAKAAQNLTYSAIKGQCEIAKSGGKYACEAYKAAAQTACLASNIFNGDLFGPADVNLFVRAMDVNPMTPPPEYVLPAIVHGGLAGELQMLASTHIRIGASYNSDDVGDDLNHIVELLIARLRFPTAISDNATHEYAVQRRNSYGSYFGAYYAQYGNACADQPSKIAYGISHGWKPDVSAVYGAVKWYHQPCVGANPQLATLYGDIIEHYIQ